MSFSIVPYRGSGVGLNDVLAGQIDTYVDQLSSSLPHLQSGKLRPLLVIGEKRAPEIPNVPTLAETGCKPFDGGTTLGIFVRHDTPAPIINTLNAAAVAALDEPAIKQKFTELGATVRPSTPAEFVAFMKTEEAGIGELAAKGLLKPRIGVARRRPYLAFALPWPFGSPALPLASASLSSARFFGIERLHRLARVAESTSPFFR